MQRKPDIGDMSYTLFLIYGRISGRVPLHYYPNSNTAL